MVCGYVPRMAKRITPTEKQIQLLSELTDDQLFDQAVEAMRALNIRAKKVRDQRNQYIRSSKYSYLYEKQLENIYSLKNKFLELLLRANKAELKFFDVVEEEYLFTCNCWRGSRYEEYCQECGRQKQLVEETVRWYLVVYKNYSFHQPEMIWDLAEKAEKILEHDPYQEAKPIPQIGLTIAAQTKCIEMAMSKLHSIYMIAKVAAEASHQ